MAISSARWIYHSKDDTIRVIFPFKVAAWATKDVFKWLEGLGKPFCSEIVSEDEADDKWTVLKAPTEHPMEFVFYFKEASHAVEFKLRFG